jgi:hypothetical protein
MQNLILFLWSYNVKALIKLIIFSVCARQIIFFFCQFFSKIVPHLEQKHKDETEVKMFRVLSKGKIKIKYHIG